MPGGDGTGPFGTYVNCLPTGAEQNYVFGRGGQAGAGIGRRGPGMGGRGRGHMRRFYATGVPGWRLMHPVTQPQSVSAQPPAVAAIRKEKELAMLKEQKDAIEKRIAELDIKG